MHSIRKSSLGFVDKHIYAIAFVFSAGATIASLVLTNIYDYIPCELCWYQRILMFPIPILLGIGILRQDKHSFTYVLPFSVVGAIIALYQSLLQWDIISESSLTCSLTSGSCAEPEILLLGFLTIPFGAFLSFSGISLLMMRAHTITEGKRFHKEGQDLLSRLLILVGIITVFAVGAIVLIR